MDILLGGIIAVIVYLYVHRNDSKFKVGQKVYYFLQDESKKYSGRITAKLICKKEEDMTPAPKAKRRIIDLRDRDIRTTEYILFEVQPILGGEKIFLSEKNIFDNPNIKAS